MSSSAFTVRKKRIKAVEDGKVYAYDTYRVEGTLKGARIRKNFKNREEALGEKQRLEIEAANETGEVSARATSLTVDQLREAEAAFQRLAGKYTLSRAVDFFFAEYREPKTDKTLSEVLDIFLTEEIAQRVATKTMTTLVANNYRMDLRRFLVDYGQLRPHELSTFQIIKWMEDQKCPQLDDRGKEVKDAAGATVMVKWSKKRWNNYRGLLNPFFVWMIAEPRRWLAKNPVEAVRRYSKKDMDNPEPEILTIERCVDLMQLAMAYKDGAMVPYFALCLFAGLRPSTRGGEVVKLASRPDADALINVKGGHIRVPKEIAKGRFVRGIEIQPNLAAWLMAYPLSKYPVAPTNNESMIDFIRGKLGLGHDVLRHTFISMHAEKFQSVGSTAKQAGNSEQMIRDHYLNLVQKQEAGWFWSITPKSVQPSATRLAQIQTAIAGKEFIPFELPEPDEPQD